MLKFSQSSQERRRTEKWNLLGGVMFLMLGTAMWFGLDANYETILEAIFAKLFSWALAMGLGIVMIGTAVYSRIIGPISDSASNGMLSISWFLFFTGHYYQIYQWDWSSPLIYYAALAVVVSLLGVMAVPVYWGYSHINLDAPGFGEWGFAAIVICLVAMQIYSHRLVRGDAESGVQFFMNKKLPGQHEDRNLKK